MCKISTILIILIICLHGCGQTFEPVCRHKALMAAVLVGEQYPTRIATGPSGPDTSHAQAQAYINGWKWLRVDRGIVSVGSQELFTPQDYWPVWAYYYAAFPDKWGGFDER